MPPTTASALAVDRALQALPEGHRQALLLSRAGLTYFQVADRLGLPVEKVRAAVHASVRSLTQARLAALERPGPANEPQPA